MPKCAYCLGSGELVLPKMEYDPETDTYTERETVEICHHCDGEGFVSDRVHHDQIQEFRFDDFMEELKENEDAAKDGEIDNR